eukprot:ANDGO_04173.mRNA.1 Leucine--tRNA ligase
MSFARRDALLDIERTVQKDWESEKIHEANAEDVAAAEGKFMATFPYPYMNGKLHLGHAFTACKAEFAVRYNKLLGKQVLFPFGFHCTGMPIMACAGRLQREMAEFGNPPNFPVETDGEEAEEVAADAQSPAQQQQHQQQPHAHQPHAPDAKFHSKKTKLAAKTGKTVRQWKIMQDMGIPDSEIAKFADPFYWCYFFPPAGKRDLQNFGFNVDWRRSFITTDANPYYDSFIRWQFTLLKERSKVAFGSRLSIYSPLDGQPCADHDRAEGEGAGPQEYTIVKLHVQNTSQLSSFFNIPEDRKDRVYMAAATLRPETMYGQTNCWVGPDVEYVCVGMKNEEAWICTERSARNMAYQFMCGEKMGEYSVYGKCTGRQLLGLPLGAPLAQYKTVYVLPMVSVSPKKGTGVVTSVPSDSPDDWVNFAVLKESDKKRAYFGVKDEWVVPFEVVPIIEIAEMNTKQAAPDTCEKLGIKGTGQPELLAKAHDEVYMTGFYKGVLLVGPHAGKRVSDAKPLIRADLIRDGLGSSYSEPERFVLSRSHDECVVAFTDQWYLAYGEPSWRAAVESHVKDTSKFETFNPITKRAFDDTIAWLSEWACSRSFGLGTKMPFDEKVVIDSLSDSTIYMAYYTICHLLQGNTANTTMDGKPVATASPLGILPDHCTRSFWDYVFCQTDSYDGPVNRADVDRLRKEFTSWYPFDLRVSGKDLIQNHLTMALYNHAAIWPEAPGMMMPRAFYTNGHVMVDGEKMSKSKGNFLTLEHCIATYGADATRFALADAGDGMDDANFSLKTVDSAILRLTAQLEWLREVLPQIPTMRSEEPLVTFADRVFENEMNRIVEESKRSYDRMLFRDSLKYGFYDLQSIRDQYRVDTGGNLHSRLVKRFCELQCILLAPICPHWTEHIWRDMLGNKKSIFHARWPQAAPVDPLLRKVSQYVVNVVHESRVMIAKRETLLAKKGKVEKFNAVSIVVSAGYTPEQKVAIDTMRQFYDPNAKTFDQKVVVEALKQNPATKAALKNIMPFVAQRKMDLESTQDLTLLSADAAFSEKSVLEDNIAMITQQLEGIKLVTVFSADQPDVPAFAKKTAISPLQPVFDPYTVE